MITSSSFKMFGKVEVAKVWRINVATGYEVVLLQDIITFAGISSIPESFLEFVL